MCAACCSAPLPASTVPPFIQFAVAEVGQATVLRGRHCNKASCLLCHAT